MGEAKCRGTFEDRKAMADGATERVLTAKFKPALDRYKALLKHLEQERKQQERKEPMAPPKTGW